MQRITVIRRREGFLAYKDNNTKEWECAITPSHAVRKLVARFPELRTHQNTINRKNSVYDRGI